MSAGLPGKERAVSTCTVSRGSKRITYYVPMNSTTCSRKEYVGQELGLFEYSKVISNFGPQTVGRQAHMRH